MQHLLKAQERIGPKFQIIDKKRVLIKEGVLQVPSILGSQYKNYIFLVRFI